MAISTKSLGGGAGVEIGEAVYVPNSASPIIEIAGQRFLKSGSLMIAPPPSGYESVFEQYAINQVTSHQAPPSGQGNFKSGGCAFGNGVHVIFQMDSSTPVTGYYVGSDTLTLRQLTVADFRDKVVFADGKFVCVGSRAIVYSTDGVNWNQATRPADFPQERVYSLAYGNGRWVAVSYGTGKSITSTDGINWTMNTSAVLSAVTCSIAYGNGIWIAVAAALGGYYTSKDGLTWSSITPYPSNLKMDNIGPHALAFGNGVFCLGVRRGGVLVTTDGVNWLQTTLPASVSSGSSPKVFYGDGLFVAAVVGTSNTSLFMMTSYDGYTWNAPNINWYGGPNWLPGQFSIGNGYIWPGDGQLYMAPTLYKKALGAPLPSINGSFQILALRIK